MIWTAFILGLLGSFHCVAMCGPIALAVSVKDKGRQIGNKLAYNAGRTLTYSSLGVLVGTLGFSLSLAGFQQWVSVLLGGVMVLMALFYKKSERWLAGMGVSGAVSRLKSTLRRHIKMKGTASFFMTGLLNGLLPCGMVYVALAGSLAMQSPLYGGIYMAFFGAGTIPVMLVLMLTQTHFSLSLRTKIIRVLPVFAMFVGILFIIRGLGLGIHYLSPDLVIPSATGAIPEMTMCE